MSKSADIAEMKVGELLFIRAADGVYDGFVDMAVSVRQSPRKVFRAVFAVACVGGFVALLGAIISGPVRDYVVHSERQKEMQLHQSQVDELKAAIANARQPGVSAGLRPSLEAVAMNIEMGRCIVGALDRLEEYRRGESECAQRLLIDAALHDGESRATAVRDLLIQNHYEIPSVFMGAGAPVKVGAQPEGHNVHGREN